MSHRNPRTDPRPGDEILGANNDRRLVLRREFETSRGRVYYKVSMLDVTLIGEQAEDDCTLQAWFTWAKDSHVLVESSWRRSHSTGAFELPLSSNTKHASAER
jgi:hypothetical protein